MTAFQVDPRFDTLVGLVERYSPSGQEAPAVDWLVKRMRSIGYTGRIRNGPGDSALDHSAEEHISLDEYLLSVEVMRRVLLETTAV
jgi:acetylornithine deacetylase/succinyl-diaminopimelate desuccinylase-like protein